MNETQLIWMNGELIPWEQAKTHVLTHGLHYGTGFFEGIRSYQTKKNFSAVFRLKEHITRFFNSAKILGFDLPYNAETIHSAIINLLTENQIHAGYIRPLAYLNSDTLGLFPQNSRLDVIIAAWEWGTYLGNDALTKGIRTKISTFHRYPPHTAMAHGKISGQYTLSVMAKMEAKRDGYDEAILLDVDGLVAEGSAENIFIVVNNQLITPPKIAILPGITRDTVMTLAKDLNLSVVEQRFSRDQLYIADEIFLTGTAAEITPVIEVDGRKIAAGKRGPITQKLQERFFALVQAELSEYHHWLDFYSLENLQELTSD